MKFSCEKETLLNLIGIASRAVTGKSSMPLLEGLLITAQDNTLTLTGYDLSMGIRTTAEADVIERASFLRYRAQTSAGCGLSGNRRKPSDHHQMRPRSV